MAAIAAIVFIALYFVEAGYGMLFDKKWGFPIPNKIAWICMEAPVLSSCFVMERIGTAVRGSTVPDILFFELHYFQRSFIFPLLIKGKSKMPAGIMLMGITFNLLNGYMQGEWIFHLAPQDMYTESWLYSPQFITGTILFSPAWQLISNRTILSAISESLATRIIIYPKKACSDM